MTIKQSALQYLSASKNLTLLRKNSKRPMLDDWTSLVISNDEVLKHKGNLGWAVGPGDLVIDVDPKSGGDKSYIKLQRFLDNDTLEKTVDTPSGGFHIYTKFDGQYLDAKFKKTLNKDYPGIDFLTKGSQCVIPGSRVEKGVYTWADDMLEFNQVKCPEKLLRLLAYNIPSTDNDHDLGDFAGLIGGDSANWSEDKVISLLDKIDASLPNDEWVKVGMALNDWDPIKGLDLWETWSKTGDNWEQGQTQTRWKSFDVGGGVTLGTISYMAREADYDKDALVVQSFIDTINDSDEKRIEFEIAPKLKLETFSPLSKEKVVKTIQARIKTLSGVTMPVGSIRRMIEPYDNIKRGELVDEDEVPNWCKKWFYINSHGAFINIKNLSVHKSESFNVENGRFVPVSEGGSKVSAFKYVSDKGFVRKLDAMAYLPTYDGLVCKIDDQEVLNSFNKRTVPLEAETYTDEGLDIIEMVKGHIRFICGNDKNAKILTMWLAHQIQFPGRQILWSPVIQSIPGVGKSFFGELLRVCLGDRNVGVVSPSQVTSDYNGWATNVIVNVLEELRVAGKNRHDSVNSLKPLITDRLIQINEKGINQYMTYNTANYICFTNFKNALPLDAHDRRWWVLFVPINNLSELKSHVGMNATEYFDKLFEGVRSNGSQLRKWLLECELTDDFMKTKQAPMTDAKQALIATEEASFEGLIEVKQAISEGGPYFNDDVVSLSDLFEAVMFENPEIELNTTSRNIIIKKLGFTFLRKIKIEGRSRNIWSRNTMTNEEVRNRFKDDLEL